MIIPGKDDNYPGGSANAGTGGLTNYLPHSIAGLAIVFIILMLAFHLFKGSPRRRR